MVISFFLGTLVGVSAVVIGVLVFMTLDNLFPVGGRPTPPPLPRKPDRRPIVPPPLPTTNRSKPDVCPACWGDLVTIDGHTECLDCPIAFQLPSRRLSPHTGH